MTPFPESAADTVIVVDDDEATRESFAVLLATEGYRVATFASGPSFLKALPTLDAGCVLLDLRMPEFDGISVLEEMHRLGALLPVILMTANPKTTSPRRARELGTVMVLEKPIEEACLFSAVRMAIGAHPDRRL